MSSLADTQRAFAAYLRDGRVPAPPPGFDPQAAALYRRLFRRNLDALLSRNFPLAHALLPAPAWAHLIDDFCRVHAARTPVFPRIGGEFVAFLQQRAADAEAPWLAELARHEWVEQELRIDATPLPTHDPAGDVLAGIPVCSPWLRLHGYRWPVHQMGPAAALAAPPALPTWLLARRDTQGQVIFAVLSQWSARLVALLMLPGVQTGEQRLQQLAEEAGAATDPGFLAHARTQVLQLRAQGSLLGTRID
ncbi:MAG TPA: putative DNA-binding domain-containing protein [Stenotrophomonas sp.]|nr:putative DNA-binding domain-containing protein [Stenotrophomonas sp.]